MQENDVVIASWSAVYPNQDDSALITAAFNDEDLVAQRFLATDHASEHGLASREQRWVSPLALPAISAVEKAWRKAKLPDGRNSLDGKTSGAHEPRTAVVAGSSLGGIDSAAQSLTQSPGKLGPYTLSGLRGNALAAPISIRFGLGAGAYVASAASATGAQALLIAGQLIRTRQADRVVVVCADSFSAEHTQRALDAIGASAQCDTSRPLTLTRAGMRPVEAAAAVILESASSAHTRGAKGLALWLGGIAKSEHYHLLAPDEKGWALTTATQELLGQLQSSPQDIDWLSLHATGTRRWDSVEIQWLKQIWHEAIPHVSAFKRNFGHTLGAAGLLEVAMLAEGLACGALPKWPNDLDPGLGLHAPKTENPPSLAMAWGAGMGGEMVVNALGRLP